MTDDERAALRTLIDGREIVPYPMVLRLEEMGLAKWVPGDPFGDWYPTDKGHKAVEETP